LPNNQNAIDGDILLLDSIAEGTYAIQFLVNNVCQSASAIATVELFATSNAGIDGLDTLCKGQPYDLFTALGGNPQTTGVWYNTSNQPLPNSTIVTGNFPGQYNYDYIVANGVCASDTSNTLIIVNDCVWVGIDELNQSTVTIYPNPANEFLKIDWNGKVEKIIVMDASGRILSKFNLAPELQSFNFSLDNIEKGAYWLVLENGNSRIVKPWIKN